MERLATLVGTAGDQATPDAGEDDRCGGGGATTGAGARAEDLIRGAREGMHRANEDGRAATVNAEALKSAETTTEDRDRQQDGDPRRHTRHVEDRLVEARAARVGAAGLAVGQVPRDAAAVANPQRVVRPGVDHLVHEIAAAPAG
jgi:hypothetical protein